MKAPFPERPRATFRELVCAGSGLGIRISWVVPGPWQDGSGASGPFLGIWSLQMGLPRSSSSIFPFTEEFRVLRRAALAWLANWKQSQTYPKASG